MRRVLLFKETERRHAPPADDKFEGIRCPACKWRPRRFDRWYCTCGHTWNTFDTRGKCPACSYQWLETQCLACHVMSPHDDWYGDDES